MSKSLSKEQFASEQAAIWARANKSDPFAGRVAYAHFMNGVAEIVKDYQAEFIQQEVESAIDPSVKYKKEIAVNLVRA